MNSSGWQEFTKLQDKFTKLFKEKWGLSLNVVKTKNIIDCNRDLVFVWNPKDNNILVINVTLLAGTTGAKCYQVRQFLLFRLTKILYYSFDYTSIKP